MTQGSGSGPAEGDGKPFDAAWGELLEGEEGPVEPTTGAKREPVGVGPSGTKFGDASELARKAREAQAKQKMDWVMQVSPEESGFGKIVTGDEGASGDSPSKESGEVIVQAVLAEPTSPKSEAKSEPARSEAKVAKAEPKKIEQGMREPAPSKPALSGARRLARPVDTGNAANERPRTADSAGGGSSALWVATIVVVLGVGAFLASRGDERKDTVPPQKPAEVVGRGDAPPSSPLVSEAADPVKRVVDPEARGETGRVGAQDDDDDDDGAAGDESTGDASNDDGARGDGATEATGALREPPPGTPDEVAAVFRKLPVSPSDRAPVGGVGATGIHVDRISMGTAYEGRDCEGEPKRFSLAAGHRPSVCVRVVHQREAEDLAVLWEQKGGATRRSKLSVKPSHAYRTRAYLVLRSEYVGDWTVRIQTHDGVELASYDFSVSP